MEFFDVEGIAELRRQIDALMQNRKLTANERERGIFFKLYLESIDFFADAPVKLDEANPSAPSVMVRPMKCKYSQKNGMGRKYAVGCATVKDEKKGEERGICLQGAPRDVRPFLCGRFARDFDLVNAQPNILLQISCTLTFDPPGIVRSDLQELRKWIAERGEFIDHVAEVHSMQSDAETWPDYRKDKVKSLILRLIFGGSYDAWINDEFGAQRQAFEPRSPRVKRFAKEMASLRNEVFASREWRTLVRTHRERLKLEGEKSLAAIDRAIFALIAQDVENTILMSMATYASEQGHQVLSLQYDGLIILENVRERINLEGLHEHIKTTTGYVMTVLEKPLYDKQFPTLSLKRSAR